VIHMSSCSISDLFLNLSGTTAPLLTVTLSE